MTDKVKEIRHILEMLEAKEYMHDKAVEDEINARIWKALNMREWDIFISVSVNEYLLAVRDQNISKLHGNYLTSLDAIKGLERDYHILAEGSSGQYQCIMSWGVENEDGYVAEIECQSPSLPTEQAARLYAVLLTILHDLTEGED